MTSNHITAISCASLLALSSSIPSSGPYPDTLDDKLGKGPVLEEKTPNEECWLFVQAHAADRNTWRNTEQMSSREDVVVEVVSDLDNSNGAHGVGLIFWKVYRSLHVLFYAFALKILRKHSRRKVVDRELSCGL